MAQDDWGESRDVGQALVSRDYKGAAVSLMGLAAALLGSGPFGAGVARGAAAWILAKFAAETATERLLKAELEYDLLDKARQAEFLGNLMHSALRENLTKQADATPLQEADRSLFAEDVVLQQLRISVDIVDKKVDKLMERFAADKQIPAQPLIRVLKHLHEREVSSGNVLSVMEETAEELLALRARLQSSPVGSCSGELRKQALEMVEEGRFQEARELLRKERRRIAPQRHRLAHAEAELLADEAGVDKLELLPQAAAKKYGEAATLVGDTPGLAAGYLMCRADVLYRHGRDFGDIDALQSSAATYSTTLRLRSRSEAPSVWSEVMHKLAGVLAEVGIRKRSSRYLKQAMTAYQAALEERRYERAPELWVATQSGLGLAAFSLGELQMNPEGLKFAARAFMEGLWVQSPTKWATTLNNLGLALWKMGEFQGSNERIRRAIEVYHFALRVRTEHRFPTAWRRTQNNLGLALRRLWEWDADANTNVELLRDAATAYKSALRLIERRQLPLEWAQAQNNLGNVLWRLGESQQRRETLSKAIVVFQNALSERRRDRFPFEWANTQNNLGNAWRSLAQITDTPAFSMRALRCFRAALSVHTREAWPLEWATAQANMGRTLVTLYRSNGDIACLKQAIHALRGATNVRSKMLGENHPWTLPVRVDYHSALSLEQGVVDS